MLLTDVVMPEMKGTELAYLLKKRNTDLHVLYMSGYGHLHNKSEKRDDNSISFIQKPFAPQVLVSKVQSILEQKQLNLETL